MSEMGDLLLQIKECWPKFAITKENLERPTQEFVVRFYENFILDCNDKMGYLKSVLAGFKFNAEELEPEEQLFLQLSKLLQKIQGLKFTLADIYLPTPLRTKNFFKIFIHFAAFIEYLQPETDALESKVFTTKEEVAKLSLELQELISEINEGAKEKAQVMEKKNLLKQEYKSDRGTYEKMKLLKTAKGKLYAEKRNQIDKLKQQVQDQDDELKSVESKEKDLLEQRITAEEYQNILHRVEVLKSESEMLGNDDIDIEDGLKHENKVLQHSENCIMILNKCDLNVANVKKLICMEDELKVMSNIVDTLISTKLNPLKQQTVEKDATLTTLNEQLANLKKDYRITRDTYANNLNKFSQEIIKLKNGVEHQFQSNSKIIEDYEKKIKKLKEDWDRYKKTFMAEYIRVSKIEKVVVDKFKDTLIKFKEKGF